MNGCEDVDLCLRATAAGRRNAVALRSVIGHHISSSPGRKRRDEANTQRLAQRWRATLVRLAVPAWCRDYLSGDPITLPDQALARQCLWFLASSSGDDRPPGACAGVQATLEPELQRWQVDGRWSPWLPLRHGLGRAAWRHVAGALHSPSRPRSYPPDAAPCAW